MWATLGNFLFKYIVMPLLADLVVRLLAWINERREESQRNEAIDKALEKFEKATTPEEKESAFKELIRRRRPNS